MEGGDVIGSRLGVRQWWTGTGRCDIKRKMIHLTNGPRDGMQIRIQQQCGGVMGDDVTGGGSGGAVQVGEVRFD